MIVDVFLMPSISLKDEMLQGGRKMPNLSVNLWSAKSLEVNVWEQLSWGIVNIEPEVTPEDILDLSYFPIPMSSMWNVVMTDYWDIAMADYRSYWKSDSTHYWDLAMTDFWDLAMEFGIITYEINPMTDYWNTAMTALWDQPMNMEI